MYSYDDRMRAVKLHIQYDYSLSSVQHELGYPKNRKTLKAWYKEFEETKRLHKNLQEGLNVLLNRSNWQSTTIMNMGGVLLERFANLASQAAPY